MLLDRSLATLPNASVRAIQQAFDEAWSTVAAQFQGDPAQVEAMRLKLAECILNVAPDGSTDVERIKSVAIQMLLTLQRQDKSHRAP